MAHAFGLLACLLLAGLLACWLADPMISFRIQKVIHRTTRDLRKSAVVFLQNFRWEFLETLFGARPLTEFLETLFRANPRPEFLESVFWLEIFGWLQLVSV